MNERLWFRIVRLTARPACVLLVLCLGLILAGCGVAPEEAPPQEIGTRVAVKNLAPTIVALGGPNVVLVSLELASDQPDIVWEDLSCQRVGTARDEDFLRLALYKDDGDGIFDELKDDIVGAGSFEDGQSQIELTPQALTQEATLYYLVVDINGNAAVNVNFSIEIADEASFQVNDPVGIMSYDLPFASQLATVSPILDNLQVMPQNLISSYVIPGAKDVPMVMLRLSAEKEKVVWNGLTLVRAGTCQDADILKVTLYADDGDKRLNLQLDTNIAEGSFQESRLRMTFGDQVIATQERIYFITTDINKEIFELKTTFGLSLPDVDSFHVLVPNSVAPANFPFTSGPRGGGSSLGLDLKALMEERIKEKTVKQQEDEFMAQQYYETALRLYQQAKYRQALDNIQKALEYNPRHTQAEKLLIQLRRLLIGARAEEIQTVKEDLEKRLSVKVQEVEIEVRNHFLAGERLMAEGKYTDAIREYERVEEKVKYEPFGIQIFAKYRTQAQQRSQEAQEKLRVKEEEIKIKQRLAAATVAEEIEAKRRQEFNSKIEKLFFEAIQAFATRRYKHAERLADKILRAVPTFKAAQDLKDTCAYARHKKVHQKYVKLKIQNWRIIQDEFAEGVVPYSEDQKVRYDLETWQKAVQREPLGLIREKMIDDPDILEIQRKLQTIKHDFVLRDSSLLDQTDYLQQAYRIPINYELEAREIALDRRTISFRGLPLGVALKHLLGQYELTYILKEKSLWIAQSGAVQVELEIKIHNVDDLVRPIEDFPGPNIELPQQEAGGMPMPEMPELPPRAPIEIDELIDLIKKNAGYNTWEDGENPVAGAVINQLGDTNRLMIVHSSEVQKDVTAFLQALRTFAGSMVAVEALFIGATDDFLEDVGVELRDLQGGPAVEGTDIAGLVQQTADYDMRFRTAYSFLNPATAISEVSIGERLSSRGGLGLEYSMLGPDQINIIARALVKKQKGIVLNAPKVMAFNGQRVFVVFLRQQAYIRDLDVAPGTIAYDPVLDTFQTGVVLDIKPVMSFDRKYITLHTIPTLVKLVELRPFSLQAGPGVEAGSVVQLPWINYQRAMTTIIVPDRGSLILGGLKRVTDQDIEASTPLLSRLPIIGALFRRRVKSKEKENLLIMLKAEIIELAEIEEELE